MARDDPTRSLAPTIEVGGQSYPLLARNLEAMRMREALGGLSSLELSFTDQVVRADGSSGYAAGQGSPLVLGAGIRIFGGPHETGAAELFDGQVTALEAEVRADGPPLFTVLAEDRLLPLRRQRRTRLFEAETLGDVVRDIAGDHGLSPEIRDGLNDTARDWFQADETDLAFLRRILRHWDGDLQVVGDRLQVGRIGRDQRSLVQLRMGDNLRHLRATADIAEQVSGMTLASFDPGTGESVAADAAARTSGPGEGTGGAAILADRFRAVTMHEGRLGPLDDADAAALAEIEGVQRARAFVTVRGSSRGDAALRVGSHVELIGVNPMFENRYAVREAVHRFDRSNGYVTDFVAESAFLGAAA